MIFFKLIIKMHWNSKVGMSKRTKTLYNFNSSTKMDINLGDRVIFHNQKNTLYEES